MKIEIIDQKDNPLLKRKEYNIIITNYKGTPKRADVLKAFAAMINAPEKHVIIDSIEQEFGLNRAKAFVKVYESEEAMKSIEPEFRIKRYHGGENESVGEVSSEGQ